MNYISLQLDAAAKTIIGDLANGLEENDGWLMMNARLAAQIDTMLKEHHYVGTVHWYSETDFIENEIHYTL